jgi:hypothetical protein
MKMRRGICGMVFLLNSIKAADAMAGDEMAGTDLDQWRNGGRIIQPAQG